MRVYEMLRCHFYESLLINNETFRLGIVKKTLYFRMKRETFPWYRHIERYEIKNINFVN